MKNNKIIPMLLIVGGFTGAARAELGVSAGASFNYKAKFHSAAAVQSRAKDPGADAADTDHYYDDGFNRTDSSSKDAGVIDTTFWGYDDKVKQYDPLGDGGHGTITMNSSRTTIDAGSSSEMDEDMQPALEVYWRTDLTENERWNFGVRAALRWQNIRLNNSVRYGTTIDTISDTYLLNDSTPPGTPFSGVEDGWGYASLGDIPDRAETSAAGPSVLATRKLNANLFALDVGPTASLNIIKDLSVVASAGGTVAWMQSDFSYSDGDLASGSSSDGKCLFGVYAGMDLQYKFTERWGVFAGASYNLLQDFDQQADGRSAELQFGNSYT
ncbi:MAG: hypothetical protein WCP12_15905, partial [bacterium]